MTIKMISHAAPESGSAPISAPDLPAAFTERMERLLGEEYPLFLDSFRLPPVRALFVNEKALPRKDFESLCGFPVSPLPHVPGGYAFTLDKPGSHPFHHAGAYYLQDPSAMATVAAAAGFLKRPGLKCLDLCAAPGGKSVQIASLLGENGLLVSNEIMPDRCRILTGNMERMGFSDLLITNADPKRIAAWFPAYFDFVLADVPCSGEGMFRKYPESVREWSENAPSFCSARQKTILESAAASLAPGGLLLYSTCTYSEEENEENVRFLLREHPDFRLLPAPAALEKASRPGIGAGMERARRFYPHVSPGEGQFFALLQKDAPPEYSPRSGVSPAFPDGRRPLSEAALGAAKRFLDDALEPDCPALPLCGLGDRIAFCPFPVPPQNVFAAGVTLGTVEKGRLVPHHQLFRALGRCFRRKLELPPGDPRLPQYLSGAELPCEAGEYGENGDGWAVVTTCGIPLGGVKISSGRAKNHYPKGLRLL